MREGSRGTPRRTALTGTKALAECLAELTSEVAVLRHLITALDERAAARERTIDQLRQDIEWLRSGGGHLIVRPFLVDLQRLRDDLLRQVSALPSETTADQVAELLESFASSIERTLARGGVDVLHPEVGSPVDASRHRVAGVVLTPRADLDGTVAEVLSDGYLDIAADRTLTSATVRMYRSEPIRP